MEYPIELPNTEYFSYRNIYTGSVGDFRYRIEPVDSQLKVYTYAIYCYEAAETIATYEAALDDDGIEKIRVWLTEQCHLFQTQQDG